MNNFAADIESAADGQAIEAVVIGEMGWSGYNEEGKVIDSDIKGKVLTWEQAKPLLDYEYDTGYGAPECHSVYVYTAQSVIFVWQYDGSTGLNSIPRSPVDCMPEMPGG